MKKNGLAKVFAIFALVGIVVSIIGTGILVIISSNQEPQTFTPEEFKNMINISTGTVINNSGDLDINNEVATNSGITIAEEINTSTGEIK